MQPLITSEPQEPLDLIVPAVLICVGQGILFVDLNLTVEGSVFDLSGVVGGACAILLAVARSNHHPASGQLVRATTAFL